MDDKEVTPRELNTPSVGWVPISLDFGRDEAFCDIEEEDDILPAAGLMVAALAFCLAKDDDWLSKNEVIRVVIPGSKESKLQAAATLCSVGLWVPQERGGVAGWCVGVSTALADKRKRFEHASKAANARFKKSRETTQQATTNLDNQLQQMSAPSAPDEESPF